MQLQHLGCSGSKHATLWFMTKKKFLAWTLCFYIIYFLTTTPRLLKKEHAIFWFKINKHLFTIKYEKWLIIRVFFIHFAIFFYAKYQQHKSKPSELVGNYYSFMRPSQGHRPAVDWLLFSIKLWSRSPCINSWKYNPKVFHENYLLVIIMSM